MDIFLLGAGKPATGQKPAALKKIALNTRALDWQIHSFDNLAHARIHFLGGYHVEEVIADYPQLSYTVIPDWEKNTVLHTLLQAPFSASPAIIAYTDTVFRKEIVNALCESQADISFGIDIHFRQRYASRSKEDANTAETMLLDNFDLGTGEAEFTGLMRFKPEVIQYLQTLNERAIGTKLLDLLQHLKKAGFTLEAIDTNGHWAEFNSPADIAQFILGTKAETLARLKPLVRHSHIGEQVTFTPAQWQHAPDKILSLIRSTFNQNNLIVRSSAKSEDNWTSSNAGGFDSQLNVDGQSDTAIKQAIDTVIESYGKHANPTTDQVLVQEFIQNVALSGVVFTCGLETGSPYYRFNIDDKTQSTSSVTSGTHDDLRTILLHRELKTIIEPTLAPVLTAIQELEKLLGFDKLDIEFAVDQTNQIHIFQVRPITVDHSQYEATDAAVTDSLSNSAKRFTQLQQPTPFVVGTRTFFGNMPDWNPAEIIGTRPKPLAFSLYRHLITDEIWATQRAEFGYRDVRPHPLIVSFSGQPYVDIRASLNSFVPAALPNTLAEKLVEAYLHILADHPEYHDKLEFNVAFTIWTPTFENEAHTRLKPYGITEAEITQLGDALKEITRNALTRLNQDIASVQTLTQRRTQIETSSLSTIDKLFALIDDCRRFGTLAFSHAARAGFVATTFLKSLTSAGILSDERRQAFLRQIQTVAGEFEADKHAEMQGRLDHNTLIKQYGHLRPGTYEVTAQAYWENPAQYLKNDKAHASETPPPFHFSEAEITGIASILSALNGQNLEMNEFIDYLEKAIQAREAVKFEFTRNLSRALDLSILFGNEIGLSREEIAYLDFEDLKQLKLNILDIHTIKRRVLGRRETHTITQLIELPTLIMRESDFYCFERHASQPNFVTTKKSCSPVKILSGLDVHSLEGNIILIPQADPGYDWLFGHNIAGLITKYGGANSHMAIRAAEMGLPAAIGVGEKLYESIAQMTHLELDCANQTIRKIK